MLRSLYRVYLYSIIILLLYFTAAATAALLGTLLRTTALGGISHQPVTTKDIVQPLVFTIIAWLITLGVGGLHYWLLRRDASSEPLAANGGVRAFMVNGAESIAMLTGLSGAVIGLNSIGYSNDVSAPIAICFVYTALFLLFEWERRRQPAERGAALVFQRLHFALLQLIFMLSFLLPLLLNAISQTLTLVLFKLGALQQTCTSYTDYTGAIQQQCYIQGIGDSADFRQLPWQWVSVVVVVLALVSYWLLSREAIRSKITETFHILGFAAGSIVTLIALERAIEVILRLIRGYTIGWGDFISQYNFVSPLLTGLLFLVIYVVWLRGDKMRAAETSGATLLTALAVASGLAAFPFWGGASQLLASLLEHIVPNGVPGLLIPTVATTLTGVVYIPLELWLRTGTRRVGATPIPYRVFRFILLALGVLDAVISLVVLLYAILTAALGNALDTWQVTARNAASTLTVGVIITAIYVWPIIVEQRNRAAQPAPLPALDQTATTQPAVTAVTSVPAVPQLQPVSIESVLDELLAGRLTRDQAASSLRQLIAP